MHLEYQLQPGEIVRVQNDICDVYTFGEDGQEIQKIDQGKAFLPPQFEISNFIPIYTPSEKEPSITQIAAELTSISEAQNQLIQTLNSDPYNCNHTMSVIRTGWTAIPIHGKPKGPIEDFQTITDLITAAQSHNCQKRKIASFDDPMTRKIGFCCMCGKQWQITLYNLKNDPEIIREFALSSSEGRNEFAQSIQNMQALPNVQLNEEMDPGDGLESFDLVYFTNRSMFGWNGEISDISLVK